MANLFSLGPNPKWYFVDKNGKPLAGGKFFTFSSLNKSMLKPVYATPSLDFPFPDPIIIDADGTAGPFWFLFDTAAPKDGYFLMVTDAQGVEVWTVDNYFANSSGGGGSMTVALDLDNLIKNNVFYRHGDTVSPVPAFTKVAPSNFTGLVANTAVLGKNPSPDICFIKDTAGATTDMITYPLFTPLGTEPLTNDIAPVDYFNYQCTVPDPAQGVRCLQFPITSKVQNLSNQTIIGSLWAIANAAVPQQLRIKFLQYFGDGVGATAPFLSTVQTFTINSANVWVPLMFSGNVPDVTGKSLGGPIINGAPVGPNDGLFLQIEFFPVVSTCDIGLTKPTLYLGNVLPPLSFQSYDEIDSIISLPRTGDARIGLGTFSPYGWVLCNDGVISNGDGTLVLPAGISSARNNPDVYPLYVLLWNLSNTFVPIYDSAGVLSARGASAIADFSAGKQLSLTKQLGRLLASVGTPNSGNNTGTVWALGQSTGGEQETLTSPNQLPSHTHTLTLPMRNNGLSAGAGAEIWTDNAGPGGTLQTIDPTGASDPFNIQNPVTYFNVFLKL